ncbi:MAG: glycosyltransferase family 2 protein [Planctomycetaceae bacterium]|nr:MAG: glycosyltransferase family 2 protein [Planctomycetaceae bacterium]
MDNQPHVNNWEALRQQPVHAWEWPRIVVGVPMERTMAHADDVFFNFLAIAQNGVPFIKQNYTRTDVARNKMAMQLLQSDFTHLLMLDVDHIHPTDIVQRLARWVVADPGKQVIGGLNFRRGEPYEPCCFLIGPDGRYYAPAEWERGLVKVDIIGTGSILISREVFERMQPPWFYNIYDRVWEELQARSIR